MPKSLGTLTAPALASAPAVGVAGALYYNTGDSTLYKSNGSAWSAVAGSGGGAPTISDTAPGGASAGDLWWESDSGALSIYYDSTWVEIGGGPPGPIGQSAIPWTKTGTIAVATGSLRFPLPFDGVILGVSARVGTAPTGADIIIDVNKNGTTIFTTQANRPKILAGASSTAAEVTNMNVTTFVAGDYLTIDIDQVGSTVAGADLTVVVRYRDAYGAIAEMPGLVLITSQSFSDASAVNVNNCFTSTYQNYRVVCHITAAGASGNLLLRMRAGGADSSAASYGYGYVQGNVGGTGSGGSGATATSAIISGLDSTSNSQTPLVADFTNPQTSARTTALVLSAYGNTPTARYTSVVFDNTTSFDGFTIYPDSSTITGTLRVYGYRNS